MQFLFSLLAVHAPNAAAQLAIDLAMAGMQHKLV
jgi:hypothetical protein